MIPAILKDLVNILRRIDPTTASRDVLNNPVYNDPTTWPVVYRNIYVRIAWSGKAMKISSTGELIYPTGIMYYPKNLTLQPMDRIVTVSTPGIPTGIEYTIEAVYPSFILHGVVDHYEASLHLPIA